MKLASYLVDGREAFGLARSDGLITLSSAGGPQTLRAAIEAGTLDALANAARSRAPDHAAAAVTFLPTITEPRKIVCVGVNYQDHAEETGAALPPYPRLFMRLVNTLVGHGQPIIRPKASSNLDFEGELAVIIGKGGRHIAEADALKHVAGYTCFVDGSLRDYQKQHSLDAGKNFFATGPLGPWMVTADEIPDPTKLTLVTRLNGTEMQRSGTGLMLYSIPRVISYISGFTPLVPGDVIATGTPAGVGYRRKPPLWMKPGDVLEVEISGIGTLRNPVVDEA